MEKNGLLAVQSLAAGDSDKVRARRQSAGGAREAHALTAQQPRLHSASPSTEGDTATACNSLLPLSRVEEATSPKILEATTVL